ncbi:MAG: succinate--CoA ligase subunit alpha [Nitrososphaerota archaeon]|nr:succinate--CoA ligase subunit alpha [Nitrososphaerales archaeon]MDW8045215.1 succinate--CoA ligase subunit alpha [Nitrososphaerota archaeon]
MAILLDEKTTVLIQGITGREGSARALFMKNYGTKVVAGVTPGRGGTTEAGVPVYDTVEQAIKHHGPIDCSVTFVPGPFLKDAVMEALECDIKFIVMPVERVPLHDIMEMVAFAKRKGAKLLGPGSIGIISPGKAAAGWLGGTAERARVVFKPGDIGVLSRSGGQASTIPWILKQAGFGVSTAIHVGTEPIVGMSFGDILPLFEKDEETRAVVAFGEIGGLHEEEAAEVIRRGEFTKPFVIYIAGAWAPEGMRFSHASSIIEHGRGSAKSKIETLKSVGAYVVNRPEEIIPTLKYVLGK